MVHSKKVPGSHASWGLSVGSLYSHPVPTWAYSIVLRSAITVQEHACWLIVDYTLAMDVRKMQCLKCIEKVPLECMIQM